MTIDPLTIRCRITDAEALRRVTPERLESYLRAKGWEDFRATPPKRIILRSPTFADMFIVVPHENDSAHMYFMESAFSVLAETENRSEMAILCELVNGEVGT
jgi:hypothetical protein